MLKTNRRATRCAVALLLGLPYLLAAAADLPTPASVDQRGTVSSLLSIDQNRATIVDRILREWSDSITASSPRLTRSQLRDALFAMRSDQLLAASLAGSADGLLDVIAQGIATSSPGKDDGQTKALGDATSDLTYVPLQPCRLVDTRSVFPAVYQGAGPFSPGEIRTYTVQGGNGVCLTQLPVGTSLGAVQVQVFGIPRNHVSGDIEVLPQGVAFGSTATLVFLAQNDFTSASTTAAVSAAKQISVQVRQGIADVAIDIVGYFRAPAPVMQKQTFTYNLAPGATSAAMPIPVADLPVFVQAVNLTPGFRGIGHVSLFRCCVANPNSFLEWTGLSSTSGAAIVSGFGSTAGVAIDQIDFNHQVLLEVHDAGSVQVHNTSTTPHFGVVTLTW